MVSRSAFTSCTNEGIMNPYHNYLLSAIMCLAFGACGDSISAPDPGGDHPPLNPVQAAIESFRIAHPGVLSATGFVHAGDGASLGGFTGFLDESRTVPVALDTRFSIGSATKTFTAVMVLQLMEEGRVQLDAPVIQYLSAEWAAVLDSVPYGSEVTIRHALSHRSGIFDYLQSPLQNRLLSDPGGPVSPFEAFRFVTSGVPDFEPGSDFSYSNTNFLLLGQVVEQVTGQFYGAALEDRILARIGLSNTFSYYGSSEGARQLIAHSYATIGGTRFDALVVTDSEWSRGVGGLISTVGDLVAFMRALASGELVTAKTLETMTDLGENTWYGLGVQIDDRFGVGRCFGHGGYAFGSTAQMYHCPEAGVTISAFYGADGTRVLGAHLDILDRLLLAAG
jgi:D-alanyl-D-alanine carboxypeptidase